MEGGFWHLLGKDLEGHDDAQAIPPTHAVCPNPNCPAQGMGAVLGCTLQLLACPLTPPAAHLPEETSEKK